MLPLLLIMVWVPTLISVTSVSLSPLYLFPALSFHFTSHYTHINVHTQKGHIHTHQGLVKLHKAEAPNGGGISLFPLQKSHNQHSRPASIYSLPNLYNACQLLAYPAANTSPSHVRQIKGNIISFFILYSTEKSPRQYVYYFN